MRPTRGGIASFVAAVLLPQEGPGGGGNGLVLIPGMTPETERNLILSVLVIGGALFLRRAVLAVVDRRVQDQELRYRWSKISANLAFVVAALLLIQVWFAAIRSFATFLGLLSAGLAIALRDLVANLAGWGFIAWRRPFDLGDRIQIGPHAGDVVDRRLFQFTIMEIGNWVHADQSTGRLIHVPNAKVFTEPLANYVAGFPYLWNELRVLVTFESDWKKAKKLLEDIASDLTVDITREAHGPQGKVEHRFLIRYRKLTPVVYVSVEASGVMLTIRYLCRPRERRGTAGELWERILETLADHPDVTLAYPTQRINLARAALAEGSGKDEESGEADAASPGQ
jgi:small-conductance mechanosensitive channel